MLSYHQQHLEIWIGRQPGLRPLDLASNVMTAAKHGHRACTRIAHGASATSVSKKKLSKRRQEIRHCDDRHWGICKSLGSRHIAKVKRLAKMLFANCSTTSMGTELVLIEGADEGPGRGLIAPGRRGRFVIPCWKLSRPTTMAFADTTWRVSDGHAHTPYLVPRKASNIDVVNALVELPHPCCTIRSHLELANELLTTSPGVESWQAYKVQFKNLSLRKLQGIKVATRFLLSAKPQPKNVVQQAADDNDPLDDSMADMFKFKDAASKKLSRTRVRAKSADPSAVGGASDSSFTSDFGSDSGSGSDAESAISVGPVDPGAAASSTTTPPTKPTKSFIWREDQLGIVRMDMSFKRKCRCYICGQDILPRKHWRGVYAYHTGKFQGYVHLSEFQHLEGRFFDSAITALESPETSPDLQHLVDAEPELQAQVRQALHAVRSAQKRG